MVFKPFKKKFNAVRHSIMLKRSVPLGKMVSLKGHTHSATIFLLALGFQVTQDAEPKVSKKNIVLSVQLLLACSFPLVHFGVLSFPGKWCTHPSVRWGKNWPGHLSSLFSHLVLWE